MTDRPPADPGEGARTFATDPSLPAVMQRAGVDGAPQVWICDEEESETY